jgi:FixJ family two-component response regulator
MNTSPINASSNPRQGDMPAVLIANGDLSARRWIEATVSAAGLCAIACDSASDLLARFSRVNPLCVILDVSLPDASGLDVQDKLADAGAAIVFLTRERCISSCVRAIKAGADDFLTLPCDASTLLHSLRNAVRRALYVRARVKLLEELRSRFECLTQRERQVFGLVCSGKLNKQIAEYLVITEFTVQVHRGRVMRKMRARSFAELVRMADALKVAASYSRQ